MGAGVSNWQLARAVSVEGELGVVSGTATEVIMARRLQEGDEGGHTRRALAAFPDQEIADRIIRDYFAETMLERAVAKLPKVHKLNEPEQLAQDTIAANFVEVYLAKEGHNNPVGINLLTKIQLPVLASLYGAMLAGVDYVVMGAGVPREVPAILDKLIRHEDVSMALQVEGARSEDSFRSHLSPKNLIRNLPPELPRPAFYPIVASNVLATTMVRKATGKVDGLIVEGPTAGGHNAPPRGAMQLDANDEPIYGDRDEVDLGKISALGLPFYLAGGWGGVNKLKEALALEAAGIQVGTAFAFCTESGLAQTVKEAALRMASEGIGKVVTDVFASPTGFPFKVLSLEGTMSEVADYLTRPRVCNLGFLRHLYKKDDGEIGYRCPSEPENSYLAKGGGESELEGRKCLCNGLMANIGLGIPRNDGYFEPPLVTVGDCFNQLCELVKGWGEGYSASDVIEYLTRDLAPQT
ncbi:MAG: nitronate monooxygenase [bacterium]|nr:nitronate monooxygenase [bacterium]